MEGDADPQKESILKHRPLPALRDIFLSDDTDLAMYACEAIARILRLGQVHIDAAIQHQIIPCLVALLEVENEDTFVAAVEAIHAAVSNGTTEQIRVLVDYGCLGPLCGCFTSATVKYPSSVVLEVLELLEIILRAGADGRGANPMAAELVEAGGLAKLQVLRQHDDPDAQAAASVILDTYFGAVEEKGIGAGSDSESDASGEADGDDDVGGEPPRQRLRLA